ncbi:MAG: SDR family oxidoreductase [Candidatus Altiarchaeota archaeon]|nr:SDR family oxidoreductase [Candidatus Altiarchaeota archaeon]
MKVLVTGGAGFIGSNLVEGLCRGNEVTVLDDLSTANKQSRSFVEGLGIEFVRGSVTDADLLKRTLGGIDCVFHQAAIPSVPRSIKDPLAVNRANVGGTLTLLDSAVKTGVKKIVYASSSSVYGDAPALPKREDMQPDPKSPYAVSKLIGEHYMRVFNEIYGLKTISLRYFNVYGPRQDPGSEYAAVIPRFIDAALEGKPLTIYGDGKQTRDFTYVADVVEANKKAMANNKTGVYNIAGGKQISINELAERIIEITGSKSKTTHQRPRPGDVKRSLADVSKAKKELGFEPKVHLREGLGRSIEWIKEAR